MEDQYFTVKKIRVMFILALLVFNIHISTLAYYNLDSNVGQMIYSLHWIIVSFASAAVPLFFIISGALFYRNYSYKKTLNKWKSRIISLVIPYFVWNVVWMIFEIACSYTPISKLFLGRKPFVINCSNVLGGVFQHQCNGPFWFIQCLILFSFICPIIYTLLKNKIVGLVSIFIVCILTCSNIEFMGMFKYPDSILYYLIGAYIGIHCFQSFSDKTIPQYSLISLALACICTTLIYEEKMVIGNWNIRPILLTICALAIWRIFDLFQNEKYYKFETESFLIYAMHINVSAVVTKILYFVLPKHIGFSVLNYMATIVISVSIINFFAGIVSKTSPKMKMIIAGR